MQAGNSVIRGPFSTFSVQKNHGSVTIFDVAEIHSRTGSRNFVTTSCHIVPLRDCSIWCAGDHRIRTHLLRPSTFQHRCPPRALETRIRTPRVIALMPWQFILAVENIVLLPFVSQRFAWSCKNGWLGETMVDYWRPARTARAFCLPRCPSRSPTRFYTTHSSRSPNYRKWVLGV